MRVERRLELAVRKQVRDYARAAREDGIGWQEIDAVLDVGPDAAVRGISVAEAAFDLVAGPGAWAFDPPSFPWSCRECGQAVSDHGPENGNPANCEPGHAEDCTRLAADVAEWDAAWTQEGGHRVDTGRMNDAQRL
jgi:hypothetical protein